MSIYIVRKEKENDTMADIKKLQKAAQKEIESLQKQGWTIKPETLKRAYADPSTFTRKQKEALNDLLRPSFIRSAGVVPKRINVTAHEAEPQYMKRKDGTTATYKSGAKVVDAEKIRNVKDVAVQYRFTPDNTYDILRKVVDFSVVKRPTRKTASELANLLEDLQKSSGVQIFDPNISMAKQKAHIADYFPDKKTFNEALAKAGERETMVKPQLYVQQYISEQTMDRGINERQYAAHIFNTSTVQAIQTFAEHHSDIPLSVRGLLREFWDRSDAWWKFRKNIDSDQFITDLSDILEYQENLEEDPIKPDFEYLNRKLIAATSSKDALNYFAEYMGYTWRV